MFTLLQCVTFEFSQSANVSFTFHGKRWSLAKKLVLPTDPTQTKYRSLDLSPLTITDRASRTWNSAPLTERTPSRGALATVHTAQCHTPTLHQTTALDTTPHTTKTDLLSATWTNRECSEAVV